MSADTLKSASVTAWDTVPVLAPDTGQGANGEERVINDFVQPTAGGLGSTSSIYKMSRVPSTVKIKELKLYSNQPLDTNAASTLAFDIGGYYSDAPLNGVIDGTPPALAGTVIQAAYLCAAYPQGNNIQIRGVDVTGYGIPTNGLTPDMQNQPLWKALGLSADPGGMIDIVVAVHTAAATAQAGTLGLTIRYVP